MDDFNEATATDLVLARLEGCDDPRLKEIMSSVIRHLHAVVRETEPSEAEWLAAIEFLTATGQICDDKRQEYIMLSDTLGVSMLLDAINNRRPAAATPSTVLGPFHVDGAEAMANGANISKGDAAGAPLLVSGRVLDLDGAPIAGALLDVWQASGEGVYDVQDPDRDDLDLRGKFRTDDDGRFHFNTVTPSSYPLPTDGPVGQLLARLGRHPYRPAHIHFIVSAAGYAPVTTHLFAAGDGYLESDVVFGVKDSLIVDFAPRQDGPGRTVDYDFVLSPVG